MKTRPDTFCSEYINEIGWLGTLLTKHTGKLPLLDHIHVANECKHCKPNRLESCTVLDIAGRKRSSKSNRNKAGNAVEVIAVAGSRIMTSRAAQGSVESQAPGQLFDVRLDGVVVL